MNNSEQDNEINERDFHDELFQKIKDVKKSDLDAPFKIIFDFKKERQAWIDNNPELQEFDKSGMHKYRTQLPPIMEKYLSSIKKLERMEIANSPIFINDFSFMINLTPKLFLDFYNRKYEIPSSENSGSLPKDREYKFPYKLPSGTRWENFIIEFLDDNNIKIEVKKFTHTTNYKEMGFIGKGKNPEPSEAWVFLRALAKASGEIARNNSGAAKDKYKHQKGFLTENLQDYFILDYDPFYPYEEPITSRKQRNSYKIKITLIPPPATEENPGRFIAQVDLTSPSTSKKEEENDDSFGVKEYLTEECPDIDDSRTIEDD